MILAANGSVGERSKPDYLVVVPCSAEERTSICTYFERASHHPLRPTTQPDCKPDHIAQFTITETTTYSLHATPEGEGEDSHSDIFAQKLVEKPASSAIVACFSGEQAQENAKTLSTRLNRGFFNAATGHKAQVLQAEHGPTHWRDIDTRQLGTTTPHPGRPYF